VKVGYRDQVGRLVHVKGTVNPGDKWGSNRSILFESVSDYLVEPIQPEMEELPDQELEW
jgi:hypothetical protein